jgi:protein-S-isoprenylcysteine O-methyltransferase Ste14
MPLIYLVHIVFFALFLLRLKGRGAEGTAPGAATPIPEAPPAADPHAVRLIVMHCAAFSVFYFGLGQALFARRGSRVLFAPHPVVGGAVIAAGAVILAWALLVFRSWRLLARIEPGHQLCTTGPFSLVRHPIYLSLDLLALGSTLWVPSPLVLLGAILIALTGDLRARSEERLLCRVFGQQYVDYQGRVPRTLPGLY